ncbi:hypothetical protein BD779DRAFT_1784857 [Infundibulicybe gibba]|nr:hypothetical protein BD779DRAFT_1784857 [Infundibulicybe gibba]
MSPPFTVTAHQTLVHIAVSSASWPIHTHDYRFHKYYTRIRVWRIIERHQQNMGLTKIASACGWQFDEIVWRCYSGTTKHSARLLLGGYGANVKHSGYWLLKGIVFSVSYNRKPSSTAHTIARGVRPMLEYNLADKGGAIRIHDNVSPGRHPWHVQDLSLLAGILSGYGPNITRVPLHATFRPLRLGHTVGLLDQSQDALEGSPAGKAPRANFTPPRRRRRQQATISYAKRIEQERWMPGPVPYYSVTHCNKEDLLYEAQRHNGGAERPHDRCQESSSRYPKLTHLPTDESEPMIGEYEASKTDCGLAQFFTRESGTGTPSQNCPTGEALRRGLGASVVCAGGDSTKSFGAAIQAQLSIRPSFARRIWDKRKT